LRGRRGRHPWSVASLARPKGSPPVEHCLACCEAEGVATRGVLPRLRGRRGRHPWSVASLARPKGSPPVERCLACEAEGEQRYQCGRGSDFAGALEFVQLTHLEPGKRTHESGNDIKNQHSSGVTRVLALLTIGLASEARSTGGDPSASQATNAPRALTNTLVQWSRTLHQP
jgi:hypothetical protein